MGWSQPKRLEHYFLWTSRGDVTPKDIPTVIMKSLYEEYLKICDLKCEVLNNCLDEQIQCRILRALPVTKGSRSNAAASGRFGLLQRERAGSREGLVQDVDCGCGEEDKTLPMVGCLGREAYEYARRQEKTTKKKAKSSNISNRVDMEIKDKAGKGQEGEEDKGLEGLEGKGQEGDDSKG